MPPSEDHYELSPAELRDWLSETEADADARPVLVDCREEDEHALCRIEGAVLVPLSRFPEALAHRWVGADPAPGHPDGPPVVVYCHHGMRSLRATGYLRERGHPRVWSLAGGIDQWSTEIDPAVPRY